MRGWGLGTRLVTKQVTAEVGMTNKMAQKWLTLIGICSFCLLSFHLAIKGQFVSYFLSVMLLCITYKILILVMDFGHFTVVGKILFATFRLYSDNLTAFQLYSDNLQPEEDERR